MGKIAYFSNPHIFIGSLMMNIRSKVYLGAQGGLILPELAQLHVRFLQKAFQTLQLRMIAGRMPVKPIPGQFQALAQLDFLPFILPESGFALMALAARKNDGKQTDHNHPCHI
ncbi:MAG: hypothetical protein Q8Q59_12530 [Luteolibacter sp.]|nr:hypothetical protein [Luteolibacter sp.]